MTARQDLGHGERRARAIIYLKTLSTLVAYILLTWLIHRVYMHRHVPDPELSLALSFVLQQVTAILALLGVSFVAKFYRYYRARQVLRFQPLITETLTLHLMGVDQWTTLRRIRARHVRELDECVAQVLTSISGPERERLVEVARELGLMRRWRQLYRSRSAERRRAAVARLGLLGRTAQGDLLRALRDPDALVKVEAARALAQSGETEMLAAVLDRALDQNVLVRAILTEALRPHAAEICRNAIPPALRSTDAKRVVAALEMLRAWGRSGTIPELPHMLSHISPAVREAALRLVPQTGLTPQCEQQVLQALEGDGAGLRTAAAEVCGRLKLSSSLLLLKRAMRGTAASTTLASAHAMAAMGPKGCTLLETEVVTGGAFPAAAALEALEHAKLNRQETVGM
jgi:HEAT repeat protein